MFGSMCMYVCVYVSRTGLFVLVKDAISVKVSIDLSSFIQIMICNHCLIHIFSYVNN